MTARKTSTAPTRIWTYGALAPTVNAALVTDLIALSSRYYDRLIDIEIERVREYRETRKFYAPQLVDLEDELADAKASMHAHRVTLVEEASARLRAAQRAFEATLKPARAEWTRRRKERGSGCGPHIRAKVTAAVTEEMLEESEWPEAWKDLLQADTSAHEQVLSARATCHLPPGCYLLVEKSVEQAIERRRVMGLPPLRREEHDSWRIGVQLTRALTWGSLLSGQDTFARLRYVSGPTTRRQCAVASIRVGTGEARSPIWAEFPVVLQREVPSSATIKWAWVSIRTFGDDLRYQFQLSNESTEYVRQPPDSGRVTVQLIEQARGDGATVAAWSADDGRHGEVRLAGGQLYRLRHGDAILAAAGRYRQRAHRAIRLALRRDGNRVTGWSRANWSSIYDWARAYAETFALLQFRDLWGRWLRERQAAGSDLYVTLPEASRWARAQGLSEARQRWAWWLYVWAQKDSHLRRQAAHVSRAARASRDEVFRLAAHELSHRYRVLDISDASLVPTDEETGTRRRALGTGRLREVLTEAFSAEFVATARTAEIMPESTFRTPDSPPGDVSGAA